jgi:hypothetical protein
MNWGKAASIAGVVGVFVIVWTAAWYVRGVDQDVKSNQEVLQKVQQTQDKIVEWLQKEKEDKLRREAERKVLRQLCAEGRLPAEDCE